MHFAAILAAAVATLSISVSAQTPPTAPPCDVARLTPLLVDPNLELCRNDSGLTLPPAPGSITSETLKKACLSTGCKAFVATIKSMNLGDCAVGAFQIESNLLTPLQSACDSTAASPPAESTNSTTNNGNSTGSNNSTTPTTTPMTVSNDLTPTPSVPSPTTSAASAITLTTSAAIVAVLMALL